MAGKYLDDEGLLYFWQTLKTKLAGKVDAEDGKGLSTNDFTTAEKTKLAGIDENANKYTHPTYTAHDSGLYKFSVDGTGHVSSVTEVTKADITALGVGGSEAVTYDVATQSSNGLMSSTDKTNLDNLVSASSSYATKTDVTSAVANAGHITKSIVDSIPSASSASETVIYLVKSSSSTGANNIYDEYMLVHGAMEKIGDTATTITKIENSDIDTIFAS